MGCCYCCLLCLTLLLYWYLYCFVNIVFVVVFVVVVRLIFLWQHWKRFAVVYWRGIVDCICLQTESFLLKSGLLWLRLWSSLYLYFICITSKIFVSLSSKRYNTTKNIPLLYYPMNRFLKFKHTVIHRHTYKHDHATVASNRKEISITCFEFVSKIIFLFNLL